MICHLAVALIVALAFAACSGATPPDARLDVSTQPDVRVVETSNPNDTADANTDMAVSSDPDGGTDASDASDAGSAAPPRQIAPLSTATVTSQRPTFHWTLAAGTDGAIVDVCRDRACTTVVTSLAAIGTSASPTSPLSAGVYYWRLRGAVGGIAGTAFSAVWEFWVGARSAGVDTSWGTTLDLNGDGYADVVVGASGARA